MTIADLDRVIESLESALDYIDRRLEKAEAREALTLLRRMREGAVEGWVGSYDDVDLTLAEALHLDGEVTVWRDKGEPDERPALLIATPEDS